MLVDTVKTLHTTFFEATQGLGYQSVLRKFDLRPVILGPTELAENIQATYKAACKALVGIGIEKWVTNRKKEARSTGRSSFPLRCPRFRETRQKVFELPASDG